MIKRYNSDNIDKLAEILKNNGIISVPTDTVYGLCAKITSIEAYNKLLQTKKRPQNKPFPVMCADEKQIREIAIVNKNAEILIKTFMPGPITLVLPIKEGLPKYINNGFNTIAIRMATSNEIKQIIDKLNTPLFMSSANISGEETCKTLEEIEKECPNIDAMLEGKTLFGKSSTIVDCSNKGIKILRNGPITEEQIMKALSDSE